MTRDLVWGRDDGTDAKQWGAYLKVVARDVQARDAEVEGFVGAWGLQYVRIESDGAFEVDCLAEVSGWSMRVFEKEFGGSVSRHLITCGTLLRFVGADHEEVVLSAARAFEQQSALR